MADYLYTLLAGRLQGMTHQQLSEVPPREFGFAIPAGEGMSKRDRINEAFAVASRKAVAEFALALAERDGDVGLDEAARSVLEEGSPPLTEITRRDVARVFGNDLAGDRPLVDMVGRLFVISSPFESIFGSSCKSLRDQIERHMVHNEGDWSVEYLFEQLGAFHCSRARFAALIQLAVHPLARRGQDQLDMVDSLNKILSRDGWHLIATAEESGYPVFEMQVVRRGVDGVAKNLVFASRGPKPV